MTTNPTPAQGEHVPLWTPQSFVAAFESYEQGDIDRYDAIATVVVTMMRQYEATLTSLRQQLNAANATHKCDVAELANYIGEVIEYGENLCTRITEEWACRVRVRITAERARYRELTGREYESEADHAE